MRQLEKLTIRKFKSVFDQTLSLQRLNIFIGSNGAGKSNLIQVFRFLREIVTQNLATYTQQKGGADNLLYFGRKHSPEMELLLEFGEGNISNAYRVKLQGTDIGALYIKEETAYYHEKKNYPGPYERTVALATPESKLKSVDHICARQVLADLESYRVYHFHDTSDTAAVKGTCEVNDNRYLRSQAENLAAFLYWMKQREPNSYSTIEDAIRQIAPFFDGFRLEPSRLNEKAIMIEWKERGSDAYFSASSLSDGTLRFICLATLLLQPKLPSLILIDEPELGLHPAAIRVLADLLSSASTRTQVIVSTQSVTLVNQFDQTEVWAVDRVDGKSKFRHLSSEDMTHWLDDYSLGELWEKNILGARP